MQNLLTSLFNALTQYVQHGVGNGKESLNVEQEEAFLNYYCSATQPLLYGLGKDFLTTEFMSSVLQLIEMLFQKFSRVIYGGLITY